MPPKPLDAYSAPYSARPRAASVFTPPLIVCLVIVGSRKRESWSIPGAQRSGSSVLVRFGVAWAHGYCRTSTMLEVKRLEAQGGAPPDAGEGSPPGYRSEPLEAHQEADSVLSGRIDAAEVELPDAVHESRVEIHLVGNVVDEAGNLPVSLGRGVNRPRVPPPDIAGRRVAQASIDVRPEVRDLGSPEVAVIVAVQAQSQIRARAAQCPVVVSPDVVGFLGRAAELGVFRELGARVYVDVCRIEPTEI